jgi:hypothetical protein
MGGMGPQTLSAGLQGAAWHEVAQTEMTGAFPRLVSTWSESGSMERFVCRDRVEVVDPA